MAASKIEFPLHLAPRVTRGSQVSSEAGTWSLRIPAGEGRSYRLAQLDDYGQRARRDFAWRPPVTIKLQARVSGPDLPGTWGFGFWNDPFGLSLGFGGTPARLPCLPDCAWFFHASPPNHLSLDDRVPGSGFFAGTFRSRRLPTLLLPFALPGLPLLAIRPVSRLFRRMAARWVRQSGAPVHVDVSGWHAYEIRWLPERCEFLVDGSLLLRTELVPAGPLGLVLWIDNQFAAWEPDGDIKVGTLSGEDAWLELSQWKLLR
jgi:hypothetical protein